MMLLLSQDLFQVFFRGADRGNVVVYDQITQYIRGNECGKRRAEPDVPDAQMQQRQKDTYGFLFIPGENHGKREIVYTAAKGLCEGSCDTDRAVRIVALAHIHDAGQSPNRTEIQIQTGILRKCRLISIR